jgi:hypothetical protein
MHMYDNDYNTNTTDYDQNQPQNRDRRWNHRLGLGDDHGNDINEDDNEERHLYDDWDAFSVLDDLPTWLILVGAM